jgi:hypothetical protein
MIEPNVAALTSAVIANLLIANGGCVSGKHPVTTVWTSA